MTLLCGGTAPLSMGAHLKPEMAAVSSGYAPPRLDRSCLFIALISQYDARRAPENKENLVDQNSLDGRKVFLRIFNN